MSKINNGLILSWLWLSLGCGVLERESTDIFSHKTVNNLVIAVPMKPSINAQITMARIEQLLTQKDSIPADQMAELHYQRGVLYDSFGLDGLAQYDFSLALEYKPNMAKAFHFLGVQHTQNQDFSKAYEAFDSVLEIEPSHTYALLNRAIALYYGGRSQLAFDDIVAFHAFDKTDPYRLFWLYLVKASIDSANAQQLLMQNTAFVEQSHWSHGLFDVFLGATTEDQFLTTVYTDINTDQALAHKLCEAYFYLGMWHRLNSRNATAQNYFKLALSTNVFEFVEHRFARLELAILADKQ